MMRTSKHLQGAHDQKSHGSWAAYGAERQTALQQRAGEIAAAQGFGEDEPREIPDMLADGDEDGIRATVEAIYGGFSHGEFSTEVTISQEHLDFSSGRGTGNWAVKGRVLDSQGQEVGIFERVLRSDGTAYHSLFELNDDRVQGTVFGTAFTRHVENGYIVTGMDQITLYAALSQGAYVWARMGFDFYHDGDRAAAADMVEWVVNQGQYDDPDGAAADLVERVRNGEAPTAYEFSQVGRRSGQDPKTDPWLGYDAMRSLGGWKAVKDLSPVAADYRRNAGIEKANKVNVAVAKAFEDWIMYCEKTYRDFNPERPTMQQLDDEFRIYAERLVGL